MTVPHIAIRTSLVKLTICFVTFASTVESPTTIISPVFVPNLAVASIRTTTSFSSGEIVINSGRMALLNWIFQRQLPKLNKCFRPSSPWFLTHHLPENCIIVLDIVPLVCGRCSVNGMYILPYFPCSGRVSITINGSIDSKSLLPSPNSINLVVPILGRC